VASQGRKYELRARALKLADTRRRIVQAAAGLHAEVGPARTTVTEIARRAGVRRATVYNHFPGESDLFAACGDYSLSRNPPPDISTALALEAPTGSLHAVLSAFYGWYRTTAPSRENLQRDRLLVPALDAAMTVRVDRPLAALVDALATRFASGDGSAMVHATVALALDFWTWRRLTGDGLSDEDAAAVMVGAVEAAAGYRRSVADHAAASVVPGAPRPD
jgi:AcrR family transcriptional regulator